MGIRGGKVLELREEVVRGSTGSKRRGKEEKDVNIGEVNVGYTVKGN